jgi:carboxypeptidase C (cathepsin A)
LYECLIQFFKLFPEYQTNPFYPFGESYAGKFVPTIAKKIHDENQSAQASILQNSPFWPKSS